MDLFIVTKKEKKILIGVMIALAFIWCLPIYSAIRNSLIFNGIKNYSSVLSEPIDGIYIYQSFFNTMIIAIGHAILVVLISALSGYAFSKINFPMKNIIYYTIVICLAVPGTVILVPMFTILRNLGIYNTFFAVILPEATLTLPFGVLMMRNYYDSFSRGISEAAKIDGANTFQTFYKVFLPLSKPATINLGVLCVMWSFQDYLLPLMFLSDKEKMTATVAVSSYKAAMGYMPADMGRYNASLVVLAIPSIVLFAVLKRYIKSGIMSGSVKG